MADHWQCYNESQQNLLKELLDTCKVPFVVLNNRGFTMDQ
jgi:hypothetical protein